jgi:hypothetical protein
MKRSGIDIDAYVQMADDVKNIKESADADFQSIPDSDWPILDPAALYGLPGDIVRAIEPHTEADPAALLIQALAFFGNACGRSRFYLVEADRHYPNLFAVLVGPTSKGRKGTSKGQISALFHSVDETWTVTRVLSGLSSGEGLIWSVRDPIFKKEPIKDKSRVLEYQNVMIDEGVEDKRVLAMEPEFASILRVLGRDGNTLSAILRNAWDNGNLRVLTKNSPAAATGAHVSVVAHITEDELRRYLDSTEAANGFGNRFLWCCVRRSKCLPEGGEIWKVDFTPILHKLRRALDFARHDGRMEFSAEAKQLWRTVYRELSDGHSGLLGCVTSRAEAQVVRLALVYALTDCAEQIGPAHLVAALALWEYCENSARYVFRDALGDPVADEIYAALKRTPTGLTRTQISNLFSRNRNAGQIGNALSLLVNQGKIRTETIETEGRPAEVWLAITAEQGKQA